MDIFVTDKWKRVRRRDSTCVLLKLPFESSILSILLAIGYLHLLSVLINTIHPPSDRRERLRAGPCPPRLAKYAFRMGDGRLCAISGRRALADRCGV